MENTENVLGNLVRTIERLCLENEILKIMLQENWATAQKVSWQTALRENCTDKRTQFHSQSPISEILFSLPLDVPAPCVSILQVLTEAIHKTAQESDLRVDESKETL
jgi:hypothetical protein